MENPQPGSDRDKYTSSSSSTASPISAVTNFWKEFDLEKERYVLDEQGVKIADNQENSQKNRRKLAESYKEFKKASADEKSSLFNSLLKGFQDEVDNLTKRAKFAENAFLNIYQKIYEAPDPYPSLASISEQDMKLSDLELENRKMKVELEEFRTEATHLKNQQATIRRLEERNRQLEQQMEEKVKEIVEIKQRSLAEENQKTLEVLKDREQLLQDQLRQAKESVSNMQKLHELAQSQMFELRAQSDEDRAAKQSEVNLLMDEVERAQTRLLSLEREKGILRTQLQSANEDTDKKSDDIDSNTILENSLIAKEKIISELNMELHNIETTLSNEREEHINDIKKLNSLLHEKEVALEEMKKEIQARPTEKLVDDLRKKVKILQAVGYNSIEAEDWEVATSGEEMSKMESLLLDKNKKMEHEITQMKVKLLEKASLLETAEGTIAKLTAKVNEQQKLIQKLEDDILKGYNSKDQRNNLFDDWDLSEARSTELSESTDQKHVSSDQDQSSMLKVICNQRDRFRTRLRETEEETRQLKEKIGQLTAELERSKADNVKLYGKIRYVQDYNLEKVVSRGSKKNVEDLESGFSSEVESKYKKIYEDDINPFAAFSKKERDQRYKELGFRDRITLSSGRFLLGNKYARTFAFFYTIGLHILVFTCLYRMSALSYLSNGAEDVGDKPLTLNLRQAL
ncbi:protein CASP [Cannabis sativa]|uniref:protein CASP n=1 Tax=Cannabis sativa TaxID=3483 RepID=UPI0029CA80B9|nr:protein CASP [Cannabis sativa]